MRLSATIEARVECAPTDEHQRAALADPYSYKALSCKQAKERTLVKPGPTQAPKSKGRDV